jgi:transcriptional regulator with XRE-family HTH domain/sRNA-binding regulator protein Hfq
MSTLRNLRERKGLTASQLAAKAGISSRVIAEYEEGRSAITLPHAKILAKALWVGIEDILPRAGTSPVPSSLSQSPAYSQPQPNVAPPAPRPAVAPQAESRPAQAPSARPIGAQAQGVGQPPQPDAPVAQVDVQRPPRLGNAGTGPHARSADGKGLGAARSAPRPVSPPSTISDGQLQELGRLAVKLEIDAAQLEERLGKKLSELTRPEAKDWIKRVRAMAEEIAPGKKAYGQWPGGQMDQEAQYLAAQKEAGAHFTFKLFNGEELSGLISDFTPYTITINTGGSGDDLVLRKLAIAYYRRTPAPTAASETPAPSPKRTRQTKAKTEEQAVEPAPTTPPIMSTDAPPNTPTETPVGAGAETPNPVDAQQAGIDSDRADEPATPEADNMDEDRGV